MATTPGLAYSSWASFPGDEISDNTFTGNAGPAILLQGGNAQVIESNDIENNTVGIEIDADSSATVNSNTISGNTGDGVLLAVGSSATFTGNAIENNGAAGVEVQTASAVSLAGNLLSGNLWDIMADGSSQQITGAGTNIFYVNAPDGGDVLTGGGGSNQYVFSSASGQNTITDFSVAADVLDLRQTAVGGLDFSSITITDTGDGALVDLGDGYSVLLSGIAASDLSASNFLFNGYES